MDEDTKDNIEIARQCTNFKNIYCKNKDCTATFCPLNKHWDYV